ncbi:snRNA-activating protein complex subunit 1-like [Oculina patagonica]
MAEGLITDCRMLLSRFENLKTVRFERFCEVWREMNFSLIHCAGRDSNRRIQVVDYLFRIISTYLDSTPCSFQYRIGALYALYAIYHTQLCQPKVKIRMTLTMMKDLKELHKQIIEQQHHDADYILRRLNNEKAFFFVAMPIPLFYGSKEAITSQEESQKSVLIDDVNDNVEERFRALEYLEEAHSNYKEMKNKLLEAGTISSDRSLNAVSDDLMSDVACELQKFDDWKRTRCQKHVLEKKIGTSLDANSTPSGSNQTTTTNEVAANASSSATTKNEENKTKSSRIKDIKKKSFSTVSKVTRSMRHLKPSIETTDEGTKRKRKRTKK